jgi:endonuclease/exonuclease/phosphatase family metal-dependent hydrolase
MHKTLRIASYNIHKGFSPFNRRMMLYELREQLRELQSDIVFLQEVLGHHHGHAHRYLHWPDEPQYEFLAAPIWTSFAYGKNAQYREGHHGNAVLSRYPIDRWDNVDVSTHTLEQRGFLHCELALPVWEAALHCICVHLGLFSRGRRKQFTLLRSHIQRLVPEHAPLIIAGDFNDWRQQANQILAKPLRLNEAFEAAHGQHARSYPAAIPLLRLDRVYVRGFHVEHAEVHTRRPWTRISDHAALSVTLTRT